MKRYHLRFEHVREMLFRLIKEHRMEVECQINDAQYMAPISQLAAGIAHDINKAINKTVYISRSEWNDGAELSADLDQGLPFIAIYKGEF
jgi:hypothetical protein